MPDSPEVVVVGAGLAGLACARHLRQHGVHAVVLEASDAVGGRMRTDAVDGLLLDRGFQVLDTAYPELRRVADLPGLQLGAFDPGALVRYGDRLHPVGDPRRRPAWAVPTLRAPIGSLADKARIAIMSARTALSSGDRLLSAPETTTRQALRDHGIGDDAVDRFFRPLLAGIFLEDELETSSRFFHLVWHALARGEQVVPAEGVQALPEQLARGLDVRLNHTVQTLAAGRVDDLRPRATVVATDPATAARLLPGLDLPRMHRVTTDYHLVDEPPLASPSIVLDGEGGGPLVNSTVLSVAQPSYSSGGRHLVSSSHLAQGVPEADVRAHLTRLYGVDTSGWQHVARYDVEEALPSMAPPVGRLRKEVRLEAGLFVCGDHRDSASQQGALVSGRRAAAAVLKELR